MKLIDLEKIIDDGENENVEFKETFSNAVITSLNAFVNTSGGMVIIGVSEKKSVTGVTISKETIQVWINEIKQKTEPSIVPMVYEFTLNKKNVVVLSIQEYPVKPVAFQGRYYKRVKNSNHQLSVNEISNLHLQSVNISWDSYPYPGATFNSLNQNKIDEFIKKVNAKGRFKLDNDPLRALEKLCLIKNGVPSNAAMILFSKENLFYNVHIGRFKTLSYIIDDKMINGNLFDVIEQSMQFMIRTFKFAFEITGKTTQRTEIPEYPLNAVRELLLNALVHRDYQSPIDVQIKIFDQSISFFNPSGLYGDLTVEDLKTDSYRASTRNKLLAEALYLTNDIEKYGSGYIRIRKEIEKYPSMLFSYNEIANGYVAELSYDIQKTTTDINEIGTVNPEIGTVNPEIGTVKSLKAKTEKFEQRRSAVLNAIKQAPDSTVTELSKVLKISVRTLKRDIDYLKESGQIIRDGSDKTGYWKVL
ncbi:MAG: RNA-binding domain-containing protein [Fibrobacterota bacterium]